MFVKLTFFDLGSFSDSSLNVRFGDDNKMPGLQVGPAWRCAGGTEAFVDDRPVYRAIGEFTYRTATAYLSVKLSGTFTHLVGRVLAMGAQRHKLCLAHGGLAVLINFGYVSAEDLIDQWSASLLRKPAADFLCSNAGILSISGSLRYESKQHGLEWQPISGGGPKGLTIQPR
jgi:hypothetical protein